MTNTLSNEVNGGKPDCKCFDAVNDKLREHHAFLERNLFSNRPRAIISTLKSHGAPRGTKRALLEAAYCPFCGSPYQDKSTVLESPNV